MMKKSMKPSWITQKGMRTLLYHGWYFAETAIMEEEDDGVVNTERFAVVERC